MKIVIINNNRSESATSGGRSQALIDQYIQIIQQIPEFKKLQIYIIKRALTNAETKDKNITTICLKDEFGEKLRWCDNPVGMNQIVGTIEPDIVHMFDLGLPLHFRWLRNHLSTKTKLIGHHTGESIWVQLRLFLQQFGLRTVDAFIFENIKSAEKWLRASVILPSQPIFEIPNGRTPIDFTLKKLTACYQQILS